MIFFFDYGKPEVLGYGFGGSIYLEYYFGFPSTYNFFIRGGVGPSYLTNPWDPENNNFNMSYAMHLNWHLFLNLGIKWQVNKNWYTNFSINMNHDSNAGIKEPNGGVNYPTASIGAGYIFEPGKFLDRGDLPYKKKTRLDVAFYYAISAVEFPDKGQFPMYGIDVIRSVQIARVGALLYGGEIEYNGRGEWKDKTYMGNQFSPLRASGIFGWEFLMGRTKFSVSLGAYFYRPIVESDFIYQRYGLVHHLSDHIFAGINFKSYRHVADFVDVRIGYSF